MDEREVVELYDAHARDLVGFFARRTRDSDVALDLVGATFLAAFAKRRQCRALGRAQRAAWLYRIAANELADHFRRGAGERRAMSRLAGELRALTASEVAIVERLADSSEIEERVSAAFEGLSEEQRDALRLHVIDERSYEETSALLGVSEPAAPARVSRGLRALRRIAREEREGQ